MPSECSLSLGASSRARTTAPFARGGPPTFTAWRALMRARRWPRCASIATPPSSRLRAMTIASVSSIHSSGASCASCAAIAIPSRISPGPRTAAGSCPRHSIRPSASSMCPPAWRLDGQCPALLRCPAFLRCPALLRCPVVCPSPSSAPPSACPLPSALCLALCSGPLPARILGRAALPP